MSPLSPDPLHRAGPDLERAEPRQSEPMLPARTPRLMVRFTNGSWALCWIGPWQKRGQGWIVRLTWGDSGAIRDGWFHHDRTKIVPVSELEV